MATSNVGENYISGDNTDRTEWVPLTLTLVEYPRGKISVTFQ